jgi:hypothetical protein
VCSGLKSHFRITAWAGLSLMDDLVRANIWDTARAPFVDSNALILSGLAEVR